MSTYEDFEGDLSQFILRVNAPTRLSDLIEHLEVANSLEWRHFITSKIGISKYATWKFKRTIVGIRAYQIRQLDAQSILPPAWVPLLDVKRVRFRGKLIVRAGDEVDGSRHTIGYTPIYKTLDLIERQALRFLFQAHFQTKASDGSSKTQLAKQQNRQVLRILR